MFSLAKIEIEIQNCCLAALFLYLFSFRKKELFSLPLSLYIATASLSLQLPCEARENANNSKLDFKFWPKSRDSLCHSIEDISSSNRTNVES